VLGGVNLSDVVGRVVLGESLSRLGVLGCQLLAVATMQIVS
jgi:hypothetical protein